ncbi:MAG: hypothetical protein V1858_01980 [Candidatus Gottesmanbacteria bacterium]
MKEIAPNITSVNAETQTPTKISIVNQFFNSFSVFSYYEMRSLFKLNERFNSLNEVAAKDKVISLRKDLGPFFKIVQFFSIRDLTVKT